MDAARPELIALDVDGTLLETGSPASPRVRAVVRAAVEAGAHVVVTTGRTLLSARLVLEELGLAEGNALCSNGAVHVDISTWEPRALHTFDPVPSVGVLRELFPDMVLSVEKVGIGTWATGYYPGSFRLGEFRFVEDRDLGREPTTRLNGWWPGGSLAEMVEVMGAVQLPGAGWVHGEHEPWLVASKHGVSKGWALERLREQLGIPHAATLAVGDGYNDLEMLSWAGHSVAMGNAVDAAKAVADEIAPDVTADGVATVLERWF
ncbi:HAD family hydrolase [Nocardia aurantia]|uniref:5-amino-6-(5-phospho-D-ribitylamino)uracil phosphatase YcsE n=1 Tax=Nocardia aurantia TaxID=2585199 RepID=A0A7K0DLM0_9NOCA|nr:HAD family hydrolase [Nocardia aurantia]MQY26588.1 5-amino-6-(5-phospho-D-ribitylamino)uracil phosphatase YcsE [Nocardia aurantia]